MRAVTRSGQRIPGMRGLLLATFLGFTPGLVGCLGPPLTPYTLPAGEPLTLLYVVRHGWHTGIAVRYADVDPALWPESRDLGAVTWLEVGWGDRDYYPAPQASIWDAIDTVVRSTPAAIHVGGFDQAPPAFLADAPMVCILVAARALDGFARFIHDSYELQNGAPVHIRPGNYERSWFYRATGRYHALFNNSNVWVARGLRAAGVPVVPSRSVTASQTLRQAEHFAIAAGRSPTRQLAPGSTPSDCGDGSTDPQGSLVGGRCLSVESEGPSEAVDGSAKRHVGKRTITAAR
jgi:uncharacterized protein (TIGR02117 family)